MGGGLAHLPGRAVPVRGYRRNGAGARLASLEAYGRIKQIAHFGPGRAAPVPKPEAEVPLSTGGRLARTALAASATVVRSGGMEERIALRLERAGMKLRPHEWVLVQALVTVGAGVLLALVGGPSGRSGGPDPRLARHGGLPVGAGGPAVAPVRRAVAGRAAARHRLAAFGLLAELRRWSPWYGSRRSRWRSSSAGPWPSTASAPTSPTRWTGSAQRTQSEDLGVGGDGGADPARRRRQPRRGAADQCGHDARAGPAAPARARALGRGPDVGVGAHLRAARAGRVHVRLPTVVPDAALHRSRAGLRCSSSARCCSCSASSG